MFSAPRMEVLHHLRKRQNVSVFLMHIEKIDGMGSLMTVKDALLRNDHAEAVGTAIDHTRAHTAAGALAARNDGIGA